MKARDGVTEEREDTNTCADAAEGGEQLTRHAITEADVAGRSLNQPRQMEAGARQRAVLVQKAGAQSAAGDAGTARNWQCSSSPAQLNNAPAPRSTRAAVCRW
jgi:hypothetical protein